MLDPSRPRPCRRGAAGPRTLDQGLVHIQDNESSSGILYQWTVHEDYIGSTMSMSEALERFDQGETEMTTATVSLQELMRDAMATHHRYKELRQRFWTREEARYYFASKNCPNGGVLPSQRNGLYAHNWHVCNRKCQEVSCPVILVRARCDRFDTWLYNRSKVEGHLADHRDHVRTNEVGRYLWCDACKRA